MSRVLCRVPVYDPCRVLCAVYPLCDPCRRLCVPCQVPVAPTAAGGRELPRYMLDGVAPYLTVSPTITGGPALPRSWTAGAAPPQQGDTEADIELQEFAPCPDEALSVCPVSVTPSPLTPPCRPLPLMAPTAGDGFRWPSVSPVTSQPRSPVPVSPLADPSCVFTPGDEDDSVSLGPTPARTAPDGGEMSVLQRSASLSEVGDTRYRNRLC